MKIEKTKLQDCYIISPNSFEDSRGLFFESYNKEVLEGKLGIPLNFVQDNHSLSNRGVLRGLHFQTGAQAQAKLVRVVAGEVIDIVVDIRKESPTFGQHLKVRLSAENQKMVFIPRGMAHGFLATEDNTIFVYKCDNYYHKSAESGIIYNDAELAIDWEFSADEITLSEKDKCLPGFKEL